MNESKYKNRSLRYLFQNEKDKIPVVFADSSLDRWVRTGNSMVGAMRPQDIKCQRQVLDSELLQLHPASQQGTALRLISRIII
jgi:hypothetical protein